MKKIYASAITLLCVSQMTAQTFSDNFDSYNAGDYVGVVGSPDWTTWSGTTGGAEDAQTTTAQAASSPHSIYFNGTGASGGPQDVLLDFGGEYVSGDFDLDMNMYVVSGAGAYFNFQANTAPGTQWAMNVTIDGTGALDLDGVISATVPLNTWFNIEIQCDLNTGTWELFVDGNSEGTFTPLVNQIATLDLFPLNGHQFYVDDVNYTVTPFTPPNLDAAVTIVNPAGQLAGQVVAPSVEIKNLGVTAITSYDLTLDYNGSQIVENITGVNIPSLGTNSIDVTAGTFTLIAGANNMTATVSNVNGTTDDDATNDTKVEVADPVVPAPGKVVVGEEATGTWCGWCPRGAVALAEMESYHGFFAGIAVHNGDPMVVTEYDTDINPFIGGYPSGLVDREPEVDPSQFEAEFLQNILLTPSAVLTNGAVYDAINNKIDISVTADFGQAISGDWKVLVVLTEDDVTGTGSGYNQSNYYSFQSNNIPLVGAGHDWQAQTNPVPAAQMEYDHVARAIYPSFAGESNAYGGSQSAGAQVTHNFLIHLDPSWDASKMHIISMIVEPTGVVNNASVPTTFDEAQNINGYVPGTFVGVAHHLPAPDALISLYPNPSNGQSFVNVQIEDEADVRMTIVDLSGKIVLDQDYGTLFGSHVIPVNTANMAAGMYSVNVWVNDKTKTLKLIVE